MLKDCFRWRYSCPRYFPSFLLVTTEIIFFKLFYLQDGSRYYKVRWKDSWEREECLFACEKIIKEFWEHLEKVIIFICFIINCFIVLCI